MAGKTLPTTPELHSRWWAAAYALTNFQWKKCHCAQLPRKVGDRCAECQPYSDELDEAEAALRDAGEWEQWERKHE